MATELEKVSSTLNENYKVKSDSFVGTVNTVENATTDQLMNINGQLFDKNEDGSQGPYVANFSGSMHEGKMFYTTSQMTREQYDSVMTLIGDIESQLIPKE